jgi:rhamnogalacturonyl hydrolase YesR
MRGNTPFKKFTEAQWTEHFNMVITKYDKANGFDKETIQNNIILLLKYNNTSTDEITLVLEKFDEYLDEHCSLSYGKYYHKDFYIQQQLPIQPNQPTQPTNQNRKKSWWSF